MTVAGPILKIKLIPNSAIQAFFSLAFYTSTFLEYSSKRVSNFLRRKLSVRKLFIYNPFVSNLFFLAATDCNVRLCYWFLAKVMTVNKEFGDKMKVKRWSQGLPIIN